MFVNFVSICIFTLWIVVGFAIFPYDLIIDIFASLWIFLGLLFTKTFSIFLNENIIQ